MAYVKREGPKKDVVTADRREFSCADKVRGLGTQWIGTEGAIDAAKKDWMERVRYDYGESFLDLTTPRISSAAAAACPSARSRATSCTLRDHCAALQASCARPRRRRNRFQLVDGSE